MVGVWHGEWERKTELVDLSDLSGVMESNMDTQKLTILLESVASIMALATQLGSPV